MLIAILLLMAAPTTADADPLDWRCTTGDFSTTVPPYTTHWRVATEGTPPTSRMYWLHEDLVLGQFRFSSADTVSCSVLDVSRPVTTLTPAALAGQPACTTPTSIGTYTDVVGAFIARHRLIGERRSVWGLSSANFRYWIDEQQVRPGVWSRSGTSLARC
ncbi:hypothetical protein [Actinophytocola sp.]|uniref:hypothetical protein n=1 Tax=Actinophytocola sp. TaxID=1872138 RepID=UPI00389AD3F1